jgi:hypothetical protein
LNRHRNKRSAELVAAAAALVKLSGIGDANSILAAERVLDKKSRRYRASLAVPTTYDTLVERQKLFAGFDVLSGIAASQRIGATFIVDGKLRDWFDELAARSVAYLEGL